MARNILTPFTFSTGGNSITSHTAASTPLTIKGAASQSASLLEIRNSSNTLLSYTLSNGDWVMPNLYNSYAGVGTGYADYQGSATSLYVRPTATTRSGAVIKGLASQTANLLEIQDSAASVLLSITSAGNLNAPGQIRVGTTSGLAQLSVVSTNAATIAQVVRGAASQSASLLSFQNDSGTVIGNFTAPVNNVPRLNLGSTDLGATVGINGHATGGVTLAIKAIASQTADMQQWINSGNSVLAKVDQNGFAVFGGATVLSNSVLSVSPYGTTQVGLTIKATSGQSANLQNWQDSTPTTITNINSAGLFSTTRNITIAETNTAENAFIIRGAANHTGFLTLWQNSSGTTLSGVNAPGQIWAGSTIPTQGSTSVAINTQSPTGTTNITITTATAHGISVGQTVTIAGVVPSGYNGNWIAQAGTTGSTLVVNIGSAPGSITTGGLAYISPQVSITPSSTTTSGLIVKALASQSANLLEIQSSAGAVLARFASTGQLLAPSIVGTAFQITSGGVFSNGSTSAPANTQAYFLTTSATNAGLVVRGAASQSANLQEWQRSTRTTVASISSAGAFTTSSSITTGAALNLNYASPTIASNNASAASIFTATVTGVTIGSSTIRTTAFPADATTSTATAGAGFMGLPQNATTTGAYTIVAADAGKHIYSSATRTVTIPANGTVAFPVGTTITFISGSGATTTIAITTDTMYLAGAGTTGSRTLAAFGMATAVKITSTAWIISGNGLT